MPQGLSAAAKREWRELVPILMQTDGLLSVADGLVLGDLCEVRARKLNVLKAIRAREARQLKELKQKTAEKGIAITHNELQALALESSMGTKGGHVHVLSKVYSTCIEQENRLRRELGLSPSARSSIRLADGGGGASRPANDPLDSLFFGGGRKPFAVK